MERNEGRGTTVNAFGVAGTKDVVKNEGRKDDRFARTIDELKRSKDEGTWDEGRIEKNKERDNETAD